MATHSPPSAMAWIVYTMNAVYWLVTLTSPALVGMRIGLILVWGIENDTVEHRVEQGFEHRCVDDLGVMAHLRQGAFRIGGKIRILPVVAGGAVTAGRADVFVQGIIRGRQNERYGANIAT